MTSRRHFMGFAAGLLALAPGLARAATQPFSTAGFAAAKDAGGPVVLHINATWCPTCRAQKPIIDALESEDRFKSFKVFALDYDEEKATMRALSVPDRSTILVFKGGKEIARSVGDTTKDKIEALFAKAL